MENFLFQFTGFKNFRMPVHPIWGTLVMLCLN